VHFLIVELLVGESHGPGVQASYRYHRDTHLASYGGSNDSWRNWIPTSWRQLRWTGSMWRDRAPNDEPKLWVEAAATRSRKIRSIKLRLLRTTWR
jgi:hypothetical protein